MIVNVNKYDGDCKASLISATLCEGRNIALVYDDSMSTSQINGCEKFDKEYSYITVQKEKKRKYDANIRIIIQTKVHFTVLHWRTQTPNPTPK